MKRSIPFTVSYHVLLPSQHLHPALHILLLPQTSPPSSKPLIPPKHPSQNSSSTYYIVSSGTCRGLSDQIRSGQAREAICAIEKGKREYSWAWLSLWEWVWSVHFRDIGMGLQVIRMVYGSKACRMPGCGKRKIAGNNLRPIRMLLVITVCTSRNDSA